MRPDRLAAEIADIPIPLARNGNSAMTAGGDGGVLAREKIIVIAEFSGALAAGNVRNLRR